jgi:hypothetical protein
MAFITEIFCGFPQFLRENVTMVPQLDHDHFLPNLFNSLLHSLATTASYTVCEIETIVKTLQKEEHTGQSERGENAVRL